MSVALYYNTQYFFEEIQMTESEYHAKRLNYASSDAPIEVIEEAIRLLDAKWANQFTALVEQGEITDAD